MPFQVGLRVHQFLSHNIESSFSFLPQPEASQDYEEDCFQAQVLLEHLSNTNSAAYISFSINIVA